MTLPVGSARGAGLCQHHGAKSVLVVAAEFPKDPGRAKSKTPSILHNCNPSTARFNPGPLPQLHYRLPPLTEPNQHVESPGRLRASTRTPHSKSSRGLTARVDCGTGDETSTEHVSKLQYFALPCISHTEVHLRTLSLFVGNLPRTPRESRLQNPQPFPCILSARWRAVRATFRDPVAPFYLAGTLPSAAQRHYYPLSCR